jgi:integrase
MTRRFGTVRKLASGRFQAIYEHQHTGGRQVSRSFDTARAAEDWLAEQRTQLRRGEWRDPSAGSVSLASYFETWLTSRRLAPRTAELYEWLWRRCLADQLGRFPLQQLSPTVIRHWHAGLSAAPKPGPTTVAKAYRLLSAVLSDAARDEILVRNPCTLVGAGVEPKRRIQTLTVDEVERVADAMPEHLRVLVLVAGYGGLRWGEVAGLRVEDVCGERRSVTVQQTLSEALNGQLSFSAPKSNAGYRTVVLPASVSAELSTHIDRFARSELVFTTVTGLPIRRPNFTQTWRTALNFARVPEVRFHDLRHTAATMATRQGATVREVQARLGHASAQAALRYQHVVAGADSELAERLERCRAGSATAVHHHDSRVRGAG